MLALLLTLAACTTTGSSETRSALCDQFRPVLWSSQDTPDTVRQVKEHNAVGKAVCGWKR
jgi:hypothetical protein